MKLFTSGVRHGNHKVEELNRKAVTFGLKVYATMIWGEMENSSWAKSSLLLSSL